MYWLTGVAGFLLMIAPYALSYADNQAAVWTSIISGFLVLAASIWEGMENHKTNWEYWVAGIVGIFAILSPFIFNFGSVAIAMWTSVIIGAIIVIAAGSRVWGGSETTSPQG